MINYLKEVARGKRGARDLDYEDALRAASAILDGTSTPAQTGAFLAAQRIKLESIDELEAFVHAIRHRSRREKLFPGALDCASPYDGRRSSFISTFPAAFVLGSAGVPVTLHGSAALPPKYGVTLGDIMLAGGIPAAALTPDDYIAAARTSGVLYAASEQWCPPLGALRPLRLELGMRTVLNTAEKLADYGRASCLSIGIFHNTVFDRMSRLLVRLGYTRALVIQGQEGSDDVFIDRPTRIYTIENSDASLDVIDPELWGLDTQVPPMDWTPQLQLATAEEVLQGRGHMACYNQTLLNAALRLKLAGAAGSVEEGLYQAKAQLEDGEAWKTYQAWKQALTVPREAVSELPGAGK
ncbi:anthranilate phosphoribosyltransferase [Paenibacillus sp. CN-4]|uniref:anthranilate phosphoribosyltransferase n=1 Tax=Paenibacillus nanchangensis TaxID=3348343 RepID=UPI00397C981F